jgi:hypothetical protein
MINELQLVVDDDDGTGNGKRETDDERSEQIRCLMF